MGIKLKDILNVITDIIPLGTVVKTLGKGVGLLLTKKVAKVIGIPEKTVEDVLRETNKIAEQDHEIRKMLIEDARAERQHQLDFFGKFGELDTGSQKLRARIRPLLSFGLVGTYLLFVLVNLSQQLLPAWWAGFEFMIVPPDSLVVVTKWVVGFWFTGRTIEKVVDIFKNRK